MLKRTAGVAVQLAALWAFNQAGQFLASRLRLPVPGNVLGMCLLFGVLCTGLVPRTLLERGAGLLSRHYALFFIPIAVGLMDLGKVLGEHGVAFLGVLLVSAVVGLGVTGVVAQALAPTGTSAEAASFPGSFGSGLEAQDPLLAARAAAEGSAGLGAL